MIHNNKSKTPRSKQTYSQLFKTGSDVLQSHKIITHHSIFNENFNILQALGQGQSSKVFLLEDIKNPKRKFALKLIKDEFLIHDGNHSLNAIKQEILVLRKLDHKNVTRIHGFGING